MSSDKQSRAARFGVIEPMSAEFLRQVREREDWLGRQENLDTYAGQIVALYRGEVWGVGSDHEAVLAAVDETLRARASEPNLPIPQEMLSSSRIA